MKREQRIKVLAAVLMVFVSCCANVVLLELITKESPGAGNLVTLAQFAFIALEGFVFTTNFLRAKRSVPIKHYLTLVVIFFVVSLVNNYALKFNISMPLHMIFKSGSLIANMILGIFILRRKYKLSKYIAVAMITVGIVLCTMASAKDLHETHTEDDSNFILINWAIGLAMLTFALFASARMGIYQETLYSKYGKHPYEALFYCHALPLPGFILLSGDILNQSLVFSMSDHFHMTSSLLSLTIPIPKLWIYLFFNALTQFVCARSVFTLTTECTSLTVTLVITIRKFLSLIFSIFYFRNPFTVYHWFGTFLVFVGSLIFVEIPSRIRFDANSKNKLQKND